MGKGQRGSKVGEGGNLQFIVIEKVKRNVHSGETKRRERGGRANKRRVKDKITEVWG